MKKTLRVFRGGWKGLAVICACLTLFALAAELDVTGYETRLPDPAQVEAVLLPVSAAELKEPASIDAYLEFHRSLIAHKEQNEAAYARQSWTVPLQYRLRDGRIFTRLYQFANDESAQSDPASDVNAYQALCSLPEAILRRVCGDETIEAADVQYAALDVTVRSPNRGSALISEIIPLSAEQALSLYREGILPDAREARIGRWYVYESEQARDEQTNVHFSMELRGPDEQLIGWGNYSYRGGRFVEVTVLSCSTNTLHWLKENLGLEPENLYAMQARDEGVIPIPARKS